MRILSMKRARCAIPPSKTFGLRGYFCVIMSRSLFHTCAVGDQVHIHQAFFPVNRIEDPPLAHGVLGQARQIHRDRLVAQVLHVGGQPLGLVQQPLGHGFLDLGKIIQHCRPVGNAVPRHPYHRRPSFSATSSPVMRAEDAMDCLSRVRIASPISIPRSGSPRSSRNRSSTIPLTSSLSSSSERSESFMMHVPAVWLTMNPRYTRVGRS